MNVNSVKEKLHKIDETLCKTWSEKITTTLFKGAFDELISPRKKGRKERAPIKSTNPKNHPIHKIIQS